MAVAYDEARRRLGPEMIVGVACETRDDAIDVADNGADYVAFGDVDDASPTAATLDLAAWWSEVMTVPCVAAPGATPAARAALADASADFIARRLGTRSESSA
jgi:thiamine-phosphate pyrophosphorylase